MNAVAPGEQRRATLRDIEQTILSRIARGEYPVGYRLPSCERLGRQLGANKNTVSKAYQGLARMGYTVSTPGRGTFVTRQASETRGEDTQAEVVTLFGDAIARGAAMGLSADELETIAVQTIRLRFNRVDTRIGYVDCNRTEARELSRELGIAISAAVEPLVISDIQATGTSDGFDLLAVNIAHLRTVEARLRRGAGPGRTEVVPMVVMPNAETVTHVAELAPGARLLILSDTEEVLHTLEGVARGVNPAVHVSGLLSSSSRLDDVLASADAILVTRTAHRRLKGSLRASNVIIASFKLDEQSVAVLAGRRTAMQESGASIATGPATPVSGVAR